MCGPHYQYWKKHGTTEKPERHENCTVEGCGRPTSRTLTGLCEAHYYQKRRHGSITSIEIKPYRTQGCKEPGCDQPHDSRGWCTMHYTRWLRQGDPSLTGKAALKRGPTNGNWLGDDAGYTAVHDRLRRSRGAADTHQCAHCGGAAAHWAYDHADPAEHLDAEWPYSTDPAHYLPLCVSCHKRFDLNRIAAAAR